MKFPKSIGEHLQHTSGPLQDLIDKLHAQNEVLGKARDEYLSLEAGRKFEEASLINVSSGRSHAEKVTNAQSMEAWLVYHKKLARSESVYEFQKLKFTILEKEWQSRYLEMKLDGPLIKKEF